MIFSMNGFRRQLSNDAETLRRIAQSVINGDHYDDDDLLQAVNDLITHSNVINCCFDYENPDFTEMSDLEVEHLQPVDNNDE